MKKIKFNFENSQVSEKQLFSVSKKAIIEINTLKKAIKKDYDEMHTSINLCSDKSILTQSKKIYESISDGKTIVVIGIGGSNLGTVAICEAIQGKLHNETQEKKIYFADTLDSDSISDIKNLIIKENKAKRKVVLNVVSKSGETTETIANFQYLLETLEKSQKNYKKYVVVTSQVNSKLWNLAEKKGFKLLEHQKIGGRYSVMSNVGIFPLTFLGIDVRKLHQGAKEIREECLQNNFKKNPALKSALIIYNQWKKEKIIVNTFLFSTKLEGIGKWYRQLMGESIGKLFDKENKKKVHSGITPTTSIGSTDLHSMVQLFLGGPNNKFHIFVEIDKTLNLKLNNDKDFNEIIKGIQKKKISDLMSAISNGTKKAFIKKKIPFYTITLEEINEYTIGALLQMKMIEMMLLASLLEVNPFDQPNVEEYKIETKKLLEN